MPFKALQLKIKPPVLIYQTPGLIIQLKCDESTGTRLYNHAYELYYVP